MKNIGSIKNMKRIVVIGVCSGIAAFKVLDLIKDLRKEGIEIHVIMTPHSACMVNPSEFEKASGNKVHIELFEKGFDYRKILKSRSVDHIGIADKADLFVVIPTTANVIGKIANGIADDFLTTAVMATKAPLVICPAMNMNMWKNPIVQENVERLRKHGCYILGPEYGMLACGYEGTGRLMDIDKIKQELLPMLKKRDTLKGLKGKKVIVTAGSTIEEIDPVRVITNKSSGRMGIALAEECFLQGADVLLLKGVNAVNPRYPVKSVVFASVDDLAKKLKENIKNYDIIIHSAAVSDFTIPKKHVKISKIKSREPLHLELTPAAKILEKIKEWKRNIFLVGFKAEYKVSEKELIDSAYNILKRSKSDLIVANDVGKDCVGFDTDTNEVFIVDDKKKVWHLPLDSKRIIAQHIVEDIAKRI